VSLLVVSSIRGQEWNGCSGDKTAAVETVELLDSITGNLKKARVPRDYVTPRAMLAQVPA
jgi:hypothetical protein